MGLVDYGSDSDDDSTHSPAPAPPPALASSSSSSAPAPRPPSRPSGLQLPPPKASNPAPAPAPKKSKGPVRILLDLPPPSASTSSTTTAPDSDEPAKKRPKLALGATAASGASGPPLTGLAAMLPKPKNDYKPAFSSSSSTTSRPPSASSSAASGAGIDGLFAGDEQGGANSSGAPAGGPMFLPPSVAAKHKGKAPAPAPPKPAEPAVDFFGISSVTSAPTPSSSSSTSSKPSLGISSAPSISSAPPPSSSSSSSGQSAAAAFAQPTAADPYPGFTQLPSGEWVAKDQATYDMWVAYSASQASGGAGAPAAAAPRDKSAREFDEGAIAEQGGLVDVDEAQRARDAWANRPSQVPGKDGEEKYKTSADIRGIPSQIGGMARRKHQLSSLLAAAHDNRAELEERIAQARASRKGAGSKYGF